MRKISRRRFLQGTAGAAVLALSMNQLACWPGTARRLLTPDIVPYRSWEDLYRRKWTWDKITYGTHLVDCYPGSCSWRVYTKQGVVWREEQAATYPQIESDIPDMNPRGCQKGACFSRVMQGAERLRYPLKRAGERGEGKWLHISWDEALTEIADAIVDTLQGERPRLPSPGVRAGGRRHPRRQSPLASRAPAGGRRPRPQRPHRRLQRGAVRDLRQVPVRQLRGRLVQRRPHPHLALEPRLHARSPAPTTSTRPATTAPRSSPSRPTTTPRASTPTCGCPSSRAATPPWPWPCASSSSMRAATTSSSSRSRRTSPSSCARTTATSCGSQT